MNDPASDTGPIPTIGDLDRVLDRAFPREWAEEWDRVGLTAGDRSRAIAGILVTLDPTKSAIARAREAGANVLLTHHPAALAPQERLVPGRGPSGVLFAAVDAGIALIAEHTNLDRAPEGSRAIPEVLGLRALEPVETATQPMSRITVYAPADRAGALIDAMSAAGAGRIGAYERCAFIAPGTGEFTPGASAAPWLGEPNVPATTDELRVEMVCPRSAVRAVIAAARFAHPYEEPLITAEEVAIARSSARMGMLCELESALSLAELGALVSARFAATPRIWGDPGKRIRRLVTATGSAGSLIGEVVASGADAIVCGEVRYHDALDALESGVAIVEAGHDVTEWPLVEVLARAARETPGLDPTSVVVEAPSANWWTP